MGLVGYMPTCFDCTLEELKQIVELVEERVAARSN
jgi:hypothetical protein